MRWPRILFLTLLIVVLGGFLNYTLADRDVVRIVDTETVRIDFSTLNRMFYGAGDSGGAVRGASADIFFIQAREADGTVRVYRNEDTGVFGWPPYFKIRSQDWQTEAADLVSTEEEPRWVVIRHYGWRSNLFSAYPNALSITEVESPDVRLFPWQNIAILIGIALIGFGIWRAWEWLEDRFIDPIVDRLAVRYAKARAWISGRR